MIVACLAVITMFVSCDRVGDDDDGDDDGGSKGGSGSEILGGTIKLTGAVYVWDLGGHAGSGWNVKPLSETWRKDLKSKLIDVGNYFTGVGGIANCSFDLAVSAPNKTPSSNFQSFGVDFYVDRKANPENTNFTELDQQLDVYSSEGQEGFLERWSEQIHNGNLNTASKVRYIYVDRDVTFTAKGKNTENYTTYDVTLHFKKGWNEFYEEIVWKTDDWSHEKRTLSNTPFAKNYYWVFDS